LGSGVTESSDGLVVGLANSYTGKPQAFGNHAVSNAVLDPLLEVDKQGGLCRHVVFAHMRHPLGHEEDGADGGVPTSSESDGFVLDSILLFGEVESIIIGKVKHIERYRAWPPSMLSLRF
jgi:hypothetical protein